MIISKDKENLIWLSAIKLHLRTDERYSRIILKLERDIT